MPPPIERNSIQVVVNYLRIAKKSLKQIQTDATNHRETFFQQREDEEEIKENMEHVRYLRMLIFIVTRRKSVNYMEI